METIWLSISAGVGPEECAHAAALTLRAIQKEAEAQSGAAFRLIDAEPSRESGNIRSALIALDGENAEQFAASWAGIIQWVWRSAYRPHHKRKNWFVSVTQLAAPEESAAFSLNDVRFETARAGGPGGQYVNKTESAVRAVHIPTGKSVLAREERSQMLNKKLAIARLAALLESESADKAKRAEASRRHTHYELTRGSPIRVYDAGTMKLIKQEKTHV